jgi:integrase/recombinase XerD
MTLREAIEQYILWRRAHGAKFTGSADILRRFLKYADGNVGCDEATSAQVLAFLAGNGPLTRQRENKYYALAGFWRHAIMRHAHRCHVMSRNRRPGRRRISTRMTSCGGSLTPRPWRAAGAVRFSSAQ